MGHGHTHHGPGRLGGTGVGKVGSLGSRDRGCGMGALQATALGEGRAAEQGDEADEAGASDGASQLIPGVRRTKAEPGADTTADGRAVPPNSIVGLLAQAL